MRKKIECEKQEMYFRVLEILKNPFSEADIHIIPISTTNLQHVLGRDFEFSPDEFCDVLSALSLGGEIVLTLKPVEHGRESQYFNCIIDKINLMQKDKTQTEKE